MKPLKIYLLSVLMCLTIATIIQAQEFKDMLQHPEEHWYNVAMDGSKIGYMHISLEKTDMHDHVDEDAELHFLPAISGG